MDSHLILHEAVELTIVFLLVKQALSAYMAKRVEKKLLLTQIKAQIEKDKEC